MGANISRRGLDSWQTIDKQSLMPLDSVARSIAQGLYDLVSLLPIISPHGHVDPEMLLENKPFQSAADLFIYHNHYVTRLLHADGVDLAKVLRPDASEAADADAHAQSAWEIFASRWHLFAGTASAYWFARELRNVFGIEAEFGADTAEQIRQEIEAKLQTEDFLPQELFKRFQISLLATTDSPDDDLAAHAQLANLEIGGKVVPTFRPDAFINPLAAGWFERVTRFLDQAKLPISQRGFIEALAQRREYFIAHGAFSVDIGSESAFTTILDDSRADELFAKAIAGDISQSEARDYLGHMISEMIAMSCDDGLVVTLHVGVHRNHNRFTHQTLGPDTGHDIPVQAEFTKNLEPVLNRYGLNPNLHLILFSLDDTTWSREIAPLAGFYPSVFVGAPWWFLDAPFAARRFREATVETAGFYRGSGFIDDTRAFLSIPTRHDMARRVDSAFLAEMVVQKRLTLAQAEKIAVDLVTDIPRRAFKL